MSIPTSTYLTVPADETAMALELGAVLSNNRLSVPEATDPMIFERWLERQPLIFIELVPSKAWGGSAARNLSQSEWKAVKYTTHERNKWKCTVCGGRGSGRWVDAHETWDYEIDYERNEGRQVLVHISSLCPDCHAVVHMGRSESVGKGEDALNRLAQLNGWTISQAQAYRDAQYAVWKERSKLNWITDTTMLRVFGLEVDND